MTGAGFLLIDFIWLGYVATKFYRTQIGHLMAENVRFDVAAAFYAIYVVGIVIFAVMPALKSGDMRDALLYGALFGFFAYATYDLTNLATLRQWPILVSIVDVAWGTVLTSTSAAIGFYLTRLTGS